LKHGQKVVTMPYGAEVLSVGYQRGVGIVLWAKVNPNNVTWDREVRVLMTGEHFDNKDLRFVLFVGTVTDEHGLVYHVFVEK
jgi:hypothetical protein